MYLFIIHILLLIVSLTLVLSSEYIETYYNNNYKNLSHDEYYTKKLGYWFCQIVGSLCLLYSAGYIVVQLFAFLLSFQ